MAASHRISRAQGNPAYHAHSFIDFEARTIPGGAVSGTVIGVDVGIDEKDGTDVVAVASYAYEVAGGAVASVTIYEAAKGLAALIQTGIGVDGFAWATETSKTTARINVLSKGANAGHFSNMVTPIYTAAV
jgi:hypothetical protein